MQLRVGVLGASHDHLWRNLRELAAGELGRLVAVAEPDLALREKLAAECGGVELHERYDELLERRDLDAVLVFADNLTSAQLGRRSLERGLPTLIEKPMAASLADAEALLAAAQAAQQPLMINWPMAWRPAIRYGLDLAREGAVGEIVQVSHRGGHAGPREFGCSPQFCDWLYDPHRNGGGALVDYCGYGAMLCRVLLGRPRAISAMAAHLRKPGLAAEDNALVALRYERALGLLEASWTQIGNPLGVAFTVYGDAGTLVVRQPKATREGQAVGEGQVELVTALSHELLDPPPLPPELANGTTYFLSRLRVGAPIVGPCSAEVGRDVQEIIEAALRSSSEGRQVELPR
jgi:predicted dehydrogenase